MLQWVWPLPLALGAYFAPESPWNAVRRGQYAQARASLLRLRAHGDHEEQAVDNTMAYMVHVTRIEQAETAGAGYLECFKGTNARRTEIVSDGWGRGYITWLISIRRTASYGPRKSSAGMPFSDMPSSSSRKPGSASPRRSI